jgi:dihydroorotate dehydrogenase (NAD+) catalytic subunit
VSSTQKKRSRFTVHGSRKEKGRHRSSVIGRRSSAKRPKLGVTIAGIAMKNPVMTASGTFGYGTEFTRFFDLNALGAIIVKTVTMHSRQGNPAPRIVETPGGMLNSIGLQNVGIDAFLRHKLPFFRSLTTPLLVNIAGKSVEEFATLAKRLTDVEGVAGIELNISCPNVAGGLDFGTDPTLTYEVVRAVRQATSLPVIPKLSPNVTDITVIARAAADAGADALSLINTIVGMAIDVRTRRPKLPGATGGLSGPAIHPIAVRMVWEVARAVKLPLIGIGGIMTGDDAIEFFLAGASAVQVGTASFLDPLASMKVLAGVEAYLTCHGFDSITPLIGAALPRGEKA